MEYWIACNRVWILDQSTLLELVLRLPIILLALTVHEFCHAYFAYQMGDPTAYRMGRCTLNPLKHLDPLGTICLLLAPIGWAKPVPVNPLNFENPRKGDIITSAAGPISNLIQAFIFALLLRISISSAGMIISVFGSNSDSVFGALIAFFQVGVLVHIALAVFNFLPIYPLDGYHVTYQLMKPDSQQRFAEIAAHGPFIIIALVLMGTMTGFNVLWMIIGPPAKFMLDIVAGLPEELNIYF